MAFLDRRDLLAGTAALFGAELVAPLAKALAAEMPAGFSPSHAALTSDQRTLVAAISERIIPTTDTPGAIGAGVPAFMRQMLEEWGTESSRAEVASVLEAVEKLTWHRFGAAFLELGPERRLEVIAAFDAERIAAKDPAYSKFKHLVLVGYYQSEIGATRELRYELVPGAWRPCVPLSEIGRASAV